MMRYWRLAVVVIAVPLTAVLANWNDTSTGIDLDKLRQFPLSKVRSGWLKDGSSVTFDGITATAARDVREVRLRGAGKLGKKWEAHIFGLDEVWRADLDGNGTQDYVFFASGPYFNGRMTPLFSLSILLMDRDGLPVPFFTVVFKGENGDGIKHLVDLNNDGHAELLISSYDERVSDPSAGAFASGHWTNQLYRFKDFGAEEIRGTVGGMNFPFIHNWTYPYRGNEREERHAPFSPIEPAILYEHGTRKLGGVITRIRKSGVGVGGFSIDETAGCNAITPDVVVYDKLQIREIGFPSMWNPYTTDLADTIRRDGAQVELRGVNDRFSDGHCSANLIWATSRK
jgi:hypothetical protein